MMRTIAGLLLCATVALGWPLHAAAASPSLHELLHAGDWLNGKISSSDIRGKVVLVDFYTFGCINCQRTQPNLRRLHREKPSRDFVIISVHSPETAYERDRSNLVASLRDQGVVWPVIVDNDFGVWNEFGVQAWPTQMLFDRGGVLRKVVVGDSQDKIVEDEVDALMRQKAAR
ncbi:MAG: redoxin domain-containing protein [Candidatus Eremiobacteraeota bacterium]|nr:redoxin domain-containing protein [Candidatus Eremiobacteraeota bacterium]MBC5827924.1 redoxin domain-containing protein [Candidatus Eremiobacteraeota bacterium]